MKNNVLILEDIQERSDFLQKIFLRNIRSISIIDRVYNVKQAKEFLKNCEYDIILLDHDLGSKSKKNTGLEVVRFIVKNDLQKNAFFIVHSQNPVGAKEMFVTLGENNRKCELVPFTTIFNNKEVQKNMGRCGGKKKGRK